MSKIAAKNPNAWIQKEITSDDVTRVESENRSIAFPYQKRMVANSSVNQGAGFIVTSLARAKAAGLSDDRIIHIGMGAAAHTTHNILKRDQYSHSTAMAVTLQETLKRNGIAATDLRHVELYSCFPCIPKMARRVINWPVDRPITAFGGLTFGGGPIGNYMSHAVASMVELLRQQGGNALLFANGGYATHNHAILISADPLKDAVFPHDFDCNAISEAKTGPAPAINEHYLGPAKIETYTVFFNRDGSVKMGTIIARTPENARVLASVPAKDSAMVAFLTDGKVEPVGTCGVVVAHEDGLSQWTSA